MEIRPFSEFPQPEPEPEPSVEPFTVAETSTPEFPAPIEIVKETETVAAATIGNNRPNQIFSILIPVVVMTLLILIAVGFKLAGKF